MNLIRRVLKRVGPYRLRTHAAAGIQYVGLRRSRAPTARKLVLFLVPGHEFLSGGILSIFALYRLSRSMEALHDACVLMCFFPGEAGPAYRYRTFKNDVLIYPFEMVLHTCSEAEEVLLHVPAYALEQIVSHLGRERLDGLRRRYNLKVNILNQNIQVMPDVSVVQKLKQVIPDVTCTTAHPSYSTTDNRRLWGVPIHHLPAWFYPDEAPVQVFETKKDLMLVSPDPNPAREGILRAIADGVPALETRVIQGVAFDAYVALERQAKWSVTFGEGMDAYFLGVILRGGVGFAVYNEEFFTPEFRDVPTVYPSYDEMQARIVGDISRLNSKSNMEDYTSRVRPLIAARWGPEKTRSALENYYRGRYTHP